MDVFIYRVVKLYFKQKIIEELLCYRKILRTKYIDIFRRTNSIYFEILNIMIIGCHISELLTLFSLSLWIVIIYLTASASSFVHNTINFVPVHAAKNMKYNFEFSFNKEWIEIVQKGDSKIFGINIKRIIYIYEYIYILHIMNLRNSELSKSNKIPVVSYPQNRAVIRIK